MSLFVHFNFLIPCKSMSHIRILHVCFSFSHTSFSDLKRVLPCFCDITQSSLLLTAERDDSGGKETSAPEGAGQSFERRSQAASDGAEGRAADPEVSVCSMCTAISGAKEHLVKLFVSAGPENPMSPTRTSPRCPEKKTSET